MRLPPSQQKGFRRGIRTTEQSNSRALPETHWPRIKSTLKFDDLRQVFFSGNRHGSRIHAKNGVAYLDPTIQPRVSKDVEARAESNPGYMDFTIQDTVLHGARQFAHGPKQLETANPLQPSWNSSSFPPARNIISKNGAPLLLSRRSPGILRLPPVLIMLQRPAPPS